MRIVEMTLHAFGKFHDKGLRLAPGLNIIRGRNEAGKSTIHSFIEAMFYGFFKPYSKKKLYDDTYNRYEPWDHSGYSGTLTLEDAGRVIRLERQFTKGKDDLKIYDADSGEELTDRYDYNKVTRLYDMTREHIGFNRVAYSNTISLTQMQTRTEEDLIREIKDNMSNLASSQQSSISVEKVIGEIEDRENAIGSIRRKTSPYYKQSEKLNQLHKELEEARDIHWIISAEKEKENGYLQALIECEQAEQLVRNKISYRFYLDNMVLIEKAEVLESEIEAMARQAEKLKDYKDFDVNMVGQLQQDREVIVRLEQEMDQFGQRINAMEEELHQLRVPKGSPVDLEAVDRAFEEVNRAVLGYSNDEEVLKIRQLEHQQISSQLAMNPEPAPYSRSLWMIVALALLGVASIVLGFYMPFMYGFAAIVVIGIMFVIFYDRQRLQNYESDHLRYEKLLFQVSAAERSIDEAGKRLRDILEAADVEDIYALRGIRDERMKAQSMARARLEEAGEINARILMLAQEQEGMAKTIESKERRADVLREEYRQQLNRFNITSYEYIQGAFEKHLQYESLCKDIDNLKLRLKELLGNTTLDSLRRQTLDVKQVTLEDNEDHVQLSNDLEEIRKSYIELKEKLSEVMTRQAELTRSTRSIAAVEEAIEEASRIMNSYDHDLKVAGIMKTAIESIAAGIQNNFAPVLNKELSETVHQVSAGKYSDIKVNPQMELTVFDKSLGRTVRAESLSEGTIDMLYFGLRLGIAKVLTDGRNLPLILDDAFVQYDDNRLASALDLLASQNRQVLLFTCHDREVAYLEKQGIEYELIDL